ncbi:hypothetical protein ACFLQV_02110 [Calditrichota bacterium]
MREPEEFSELAPIGGVTTVFYDNDRKTFSIGWRAEFNEGKTVIHGMAITLSGYILGYQEIGGIDRREKPVDMDFMVLMSSDSEGMFGRVCPLCKSEFRSTYSGVLIYCPYCGLQNRLERFITDNQINYLERVRQLVIEAINEKESRELDLDEIINDLPKNKSRPSYLIVENRQQSIYECVGCSEKYDVIGEYGSCPKCGMLNAEDLVNKKFNALIQKLNREVENLRINPEDIPDTYLSQSVSIFEAMAGFVRDRLAMLPMYPNRRKEVKRLSFQRIDDAVSNLTDWFGFDIQKSIKIEDKDFVSKMFLRRHLFIHNNGQVDEEYQKKANDPTVKLRQKLKVQQSEIKRLSKLLRVSCRNLVASYESFD